MATERTTRLATERTITLTVNGTSYTRTVPVRKLLSDFIREDLGLTGTHVGCEHGVCGACTVLLDGATTRSCLLFAVQADGAAITTVEGLEQDGELHPIQEAFWQEHGLQCGFCTPGILLTVYEFLAERGSPSKEGILPRVAMGRAVAVDVAERPGLSEEEIRHALAGNLCRCTGYQNIVKAVATADRLWER
jgi:aerobic-type carbon monoxide dehydrogenase small subunit (CoxS/CutS family)